MKWKNLSTVIAGLDPAIHEAVQRTKTSIRLYGRHLIMDARVKPGQDQAK